MRNLIERRWACQASQKAKGKAPVGVSVASGRQRFAPLRSGTPCIRSGTPCMRSWKMEGLTEVKLEQIACSMEGNSLDIVCMQEVRENKTDTFELASGHIIYCSGIGGIERE